MSDPTPDALAFGKHKGKPLADVPLAYVFYLLGRDYLRASRPATCRTLLLELQRRLQADFEGTLAEATRRKTEAEWQELKARQAERKSTKLAAATREWYEERKARRQQAQEASQAAIEAERKAMAARIATGVDAAYFVMRTRQRVGVEDLL